jgi:hypothetical protein
MELKCNISSEINFMINGISQFFPFRFAAVVLTPTQRRCVRRDLPMTGLTAWPVAGQRH